MTLQDWTSLIVIAGVGVIVCLMIYLWMTVKRLQDKIDMVGRLSEDTDTYTHQIDAAMGEANVDLKLSVESLGNRIDMVGRRIDAVDENLSGRVSNLEEISGNLEDIHSVMDDVHAIASSYKEQRELLNTLRREVDVIISEINAG